MNLEDVERLLRDRLEAAGPAPRAMLLHVLKLPDFDRARRIGEFYWDPKTRTFAELLIDCEESPNTRGVILGMLREEESRVAPETRSGVASRGATYNDAAGDGPARRKEVRHVGQRLLRWCSTREG